MRPCIQIYENHIEALGALYAEDELGCVAHVDARGVRKEFLGQLAYLIILIDSRDVRVQNFLQEWAQSAASMTQNQSSSQGQFWAGRRQGGNHETMPRAAQVRVVYRSILAQQEFCLDCIDPLNFIIRAVRGAMKEAETPNPSRAGHFVGNQLGGPAHAPFHDGDNHCLADLATSFEKDVRIIGQDLALPNDRCPRQRLKH